MQAVSSWAKRVVIVTGGASGFGQATAQWMVSRGAKVVIADINEERGEEVSKTLTKLHGRGTQGLVRFIKTDVTRPEDWTNLVKETVQELGGLDVLVNNAGGSYTNKPTLEVTESDFDKCFNLNVRSIFHAVGAVVPHFVSQNYGTIINVSSTAAIRPRGGLTWYSASKAAVNCATKALASEYAPNRIRVNAVCPVAGRTPLLPTFLGERTEESFIATIPMGRLTEPEDVANTIGWLASDEAGFVTGVCLEVDGGRCI
ncbi:short-chain dehydrogenase reductase family [Pyrrhoderma noxium]|uniref:Short-chain dehydrogenase reductase family n=1 Tax=Pyrrhoderma noxium TaxID=2282107 RepID=A0A286UW67_9AGAM|nr:short-chain dehydrogenase reductase family [Pyrrhoderma noxium]